jgi:hypothetical protein
VFFLVWKIKQCIPCAWSNWYVSTGVISEWRFHVIFSG